MISEDTIRAIVRQELTHLVSSTSLAGLNPEDSASGGSGSISDEAGSSGSFSGEDVGGGSSAPSADFMTPSYLTIDPATGAVGALFQGGIQIPEETGGTVTPKESLGIVDSGGTVREQIFGQVGTNDHHLHAQAIPDANNQVDLSWNANAGGAAGSATLDVFVKAAGVGASKRIFDDAQQSGFVQCAQGKTVLLFGTNLFGAGGNPTRIVAHGMGRTPTAIVCMAGVFSNPTSYVLGAISEYQAADATNFYVQFAGTVGAGLTAGFSWFAIG